MFENYSNGLMELSKWNSVCAGLCVLVIQSCPTLTTPWTISCLSPPSMEFFRQEHWSGWTLLSPEDLPDPGIEPRPPELQADSLTSEPPGKPKQNYAIANLLCFS